MKTNKCTFIDDIVRRNESHLRAVVRLGNIAQKQIKHYQSAIISAREYAECNRYDRDAAMESEIEIARYTDKIEKLQIRVNDAHDARRRLNNLGKFYQKYNGGLINKLRAEYSELGTAQSYLDDKMFACDINMDIAYRDDATRTSAAADMAAYTREYADITARMQQIRQQIINLENTK